MKRWISFLLVFTLCAGLLCGCNIWGGSGDGGVSSGAESSDSGSPPASSAPDVPPAEQSPAKPPAKPGEPNDLQRYQDAVSRLMWDGMLGKTWGENGYVPSEEPVGKGGGNDFYNFSLKDATTLQDGSVQLEVELYGSAMVDSKTQMDTKDYSNSVIYVDNQYSGGGDIAVAKSLVRLSGFGSDIKYLSCEYTRYEHPGYDYLVRVKEQFKKELDASEKIEVSKYDPALTAYFYRKIQACRRIESPEEMTLFDLETFISYLSLYSYELENVGIHGREPLDSSIFELMPNLRNIDLGNLKLTDYGVFRNLKQADYVTISNITQDIADQLEVGHTGGLSLNGADLDVLDLSRIHTESLNISPGDRISARIDAFRGCENITNLYASNLVSAKGSNPINSESFPYMQYFTYELNDNVAGAHDLSGLASFGNTAASVNVYLYGKSAMPETIRSLEGVRLANLTLSSDTPLTQFDWSVLQGIDCGYVSVSGAQR